MLQIIRLGENTTHDTTFIVDRPQGHPVYLLLLIKTPASMYIEGSWYNTPSNIAVLFKPGQKHLYRALYYDWDNSSKYDWFTTDNKDNPDNINKSVYINDWAHIVSTTPILPNHFPFGQPIILHNPQDYYDLFHLINNEFFGVSPHKNTILDNLTNALLHKLLDECKMVEYPTIYYDLVSLRKKIYSSPCFEWNAENIANTLHISTGYFHSLYKKFFETTCISDVIHSRVQAACDLLTSTDKSIGEIAVLCGYHNTEHFIRQFKRELHVTPSQYRKNMTYPSVIV